MTRFSVLEHHFPILEHPFLLWNIVFCFRISFFCFRTSFSALSRFVPYPVPVFGYPGPSRSKFWLSRPVPSLGKIFSLFRCPFVPRQWRNFCPFVLESCTVPSHWKPLYRFVIHDPDAGIWMKTKINNNTTPVCNHISLTKITWFEI